MASEAQTLIAEITAYVGNNGGSYPQWYFGIAAKPRERLFSGHAVRERGDAWIYRSCTHSDAARAIEKYFLAQGMKGGPGGGDDDSACVYAYRIAGHTVE